MDIDDAEQQLFMAIAFSSIRDIEKAHVNGADLDCFFKDGETPLTEAILGGTGSPETVMELLRLGADPNKSDKNGWTPWNACLFRVNDRVVKEEQEQIQKLLSEYGALPEGEEAIFLWRHSLNGDLEDVRRLLEQGVSPNPSCVHPLAAAVLSGNVELVKLLLSRGAAADGNRPKDNATLTPLIHAASSGDLAMIELLVDHGADVGYEIYEGDERRTAETYAIEGGHQKAASWLHAKLESGP